MKIIESLEDFQSFSDSIDSHDSVLVPVFSDHLEHPAANTLCLLGCRLSDELVILPFNHPEANNLPIECLGELTPFAVDTPDSNVLQYILSEHDTVFSNTIILDINALEFTETGEITDSTQFYPNIIRQMHERHYKNRNVNCAVPLYKWAEYLDAYTAHLKSTVDKHDIPEISHQYTFLQSVAIPALHFIEKSGLRIDEQKLIKRFGSKVSRFIKDGFVYSQYNLFTATGRPSCRFGGINFAALNKDDGTRSAFVSRFENGSLILIDFESYHLRLIADIIGYTLPDTPTHEYFGRQYFGTDNLTPEQYEESKVKSFHLLYSDSDSDIPFFRQVRRYKKKLWEDIQKNGVVYSPIMQVEIRLDRIWEPNEAKVFNYLIQLAETERNLCLIDQLIPSIQSLQSKIILYNYDAILIDACPEEGTKWVKNVVSMMSENGKYPVRIKKGPNYDELEEVTLA